MDIYDHRETDTITAVEQRAGDTDMIVEGYVALYEQTTIADGMKEIIRRGAFKKMVDMVNAGKRHLRAFFHHDSRYVLGNTNSTPPSLTLKEDDTGLYVRMKFPDTQWAKDIYNAVRSGHINGGSFAFRMADNDVEYESGIRVLKGLEISEVTLTGLPSYEMNTMTARSADIAQGGISVLDYETIQKQERALKKYYEAVRSLQESAR